MTIINDIDAQKFSFNGVEYYKNFTPVAVGNKIRILNVYDSSIELTSFPTLFSDFEVDGNTFLNVATLQSALLPVLYTRETLGGSGGEWGSIAGTLSDQTDLQDALDDKLDKSTTPSSVYATDASGNQEMISKDSLGGFLVVHKNHISGASVVNNPNFTYKYSYGVLIPGDTIKVGDFIDIEVSFEKLSGGAATLYPRIGINNVNSSAGEITISYSDYANSAFVYGKIQRSLVVKSPTQTEILHHGTNSATSWNAAATSGNKNIDWTTDKYIIISIANNGALDATWRMSSILITKK